MWAHTVPYSCLGANEWKHAHSTYCLFQWYWREDTEETAPLVLLVFVEPRLPRDWIKSDIIANMIANTTYNFQIHHIKLWYWLTCEILNLLQELLLSSTFHGIQVTHMSSRDAIIQICPLSKNKVFKFYRDLRSSWPLTFGVCFLSSSYQRGVLG